jgi:membrane-bound lytic murein transglycosylase B
VCVKRNRLRRHLATTLLLAVAAGMLFGCASKRPPRPRPPAARSQVAPPPRRVPIETGDRGWGYLKAKLVADGVSRDRVDRAFGDPRMEAFDGLYFSPYSPRESHAMYRNFLSEEMIAQARQCRADNAPAFERAERRFAVPGSVCAAILTVETHCGRNTGRSVILYRLSRLAMANDPDNLERNLGRWSAGDPDIEHRLRARARYLEDTFYPEVRATFEIARREGIDPLGLKGSGAGAFGYPQFLPTSYLQYAVDGNGDGRISLYDASDAAASCANYLARNGWHPGLSYQEQRAVIWRYNRSDAYIDTVLTLSRDIEE